MKQFSNFNTYVDGVGDLRSLEGHKVLKTDVFSSIEGLKESNFFDVSLFPLPLALTVLLCFIERLYNLDILEMSLKETNKGSVEFYSHTISFSTKLTKLDVMIKEPILKLSFNGISSSLFELAAKYVPYQAIFESINEDEACIEIAKRLNKHDKQLWQLFIFENNAPMLAKFVPLTLDPSKICLTVWEEAMLQSFIVKALEIKASVDFRVAPAFFTKEIELLKEKLELLLLDIYLKLLKA